MAERASTIVRLKRPSQGNTVDKQRQSANGFSRVNFAGGFLTSVENPVDNDLDVRQMVENDMPFNQETSAAEK